MRKSAASREDDGARWRLAHGRLGQLRQPLDAVEFRTQRPRPRTGGGCENAGGIFGRLRGERGNQARGISRPSVFASVARSRFSPARTAAVNSIRRLLAGRHILIRRTERFEKIWL